MTIVYLYISYPNVQLRFVQLFNKALLLLLL